MPEERFDVVDLQDQVIGQLPRQEVHRRGLRHRAVHVLLFNAHTKLFLQKRSRHKECAPGLWDSSAAGHLHAGESYDSGALRELKEELGIDLAQAPSRLFKLEACAATGWEFVWVYRGQTEGPFILDPNEIEAGDWFSAAHIDRWMADRSQDFSSTFQLIWRQIRAQPIDTEHYAVQGR